MRESKIRVARATKGVLRWHYKIEHSILNNPNHPQSPLNPWAFIRVCNEIETLEQSLNSILGAIKRGVIVYNECTDGSEEVIKRFCERNKGFICVEYPHQVLQVHHTKAQREYKKTLSDYYNFALSFIPQNEWLIKIDTDQIYDSQKLKESFKLIKSERDIVFYFRMNLHLFEDGLYIERGRPISDVQDHWLICNKGLFFEEDIQEIKGEDYLAWELLQIPFIYNAYTAPLNTWHFPNMKKWRAHRAVKKDYIPFSNLNEVVADKYLDSQKIAKDMLDEKRILKMLSGGGRNIKDNFLDFLKVVKMLFK